jgi:hypothetical protein
VYVCRRAGARLTSRGSHNTRPIFTRSLIPSDESGAAPRRHRVSTGNSGKGEFNTRKKSASGAGAARQAHLSFP